MPNHQQPKTYPVEEAIRAQKALRERAGLGPEMFPIQAFVGMISDEVETLRKQGHSDEKIAITPAEIKEDYATPEERHSSHE